MARTKSFKELVQGHVRNDKKFAEALLREAVDTFLSGDVETGKTILRSAEGRWRSSATIFPHTPRIQLGKASSPSTAFKRPEMTTFTLPGFA